MIRYMTAGESHGKALVAILDGMLRGVKIDQNLINSQLKRRQRGYGRGKRMKIEFDKVKILSGVRKGRTTGGPISLIIENKDKSLDRLPPIICPRPGHADLAGMLKFNIHDARDILERSSARETAARVAIGSICRSFLAAFGVDIFSHIKSVGWIKAQVDNLPPLQIKRLVQKSNFSCADEHAEKVMKKTIDEITKKQDTIGGIFEIIALGLPAGLGNCMHYDKKLDARLAFELISIQAIKAISFGAGFEGVALQGSQFHDAIYYKKGEFERKTNNAGGLEGGMSNGQPLRISCFMKPISTLMKPLGSVNIRNKKLQKATVERADICALPAAAVVGENVAAIVLASAFIEKFGGDSLDEIKRNYKGYMKQVKEF